MIEKGKDWYFGLPLFLRTDCEGHELWALNEDHLDFVDGYVSAEIRDRRPSPDGVAVNKALASRMPKWMLAAKNRDTVLKHIKRLRDRLKAEQVAAGNVR